MVSWTEHPIWNGIGIIFLSPFFVLFYLCVISYLSWTHKWFSSSSIRILFLGLKKKNCFVLCSIFCNIIALMEAMSEMRVEILWFWHGPQNWRKKKTQKLTNESNQKKNNWQGNSANMNISLDWMLSKSITPVTRVSLRPGQEMFHISARICYFHFGLY